MKLTSGDSFRADSKKSATGVRRKGEAGAEGSGFRYAGLLLGLGGSRLGGEQAGYQRNFTSRLNARRPRDLFFCLGFQKFSSADRAALPNLLKEIPVFLDFEN